LIGLAKRNLAGEQGQAIGCRSGYLDKNEGIVFEAQCSSWIDLPLRQLLADQFVPIL
jgi:hypothetical protein